MRRASTWACATWSGSSTLALVELDQHTLDVALLPVREAPARFVARTLFEEESFVVVRRAGHPMGRKLTLARYCAAPHVVVSVSGDPHGLVDRELAKQGLSRRVALTVSNFMQGAGHRGGVGPGVRHAAAFRHAICRGITAW